MDDEKFYATVLLELKESGPIHPLWAKAYAEAGGNEPQARALYLKYRVEQLKRADNQPKNNKNHEVQHELEDLYDKFKEDIFKHAPLVLFLILVLWFIYKINP